MSDWICDSRCRRRGCRRHNRRSQWSGPAPCSGRPALASRRPAPPTRAGGIGRPRYGRERSKARRPRAIRRQRPGQADHIVNLGRLARRHPEQIGRMPARQVEEPRHQLIAHLLGVGSIVHGADLDAAFPDAPGQLRGVGLAVAAEEAGDRLAGFDDIAELAVLVPAIGLPCRTGAAAQCWHGGCRCAAGAGNCRTPGHGANRRRSRSSTSSAAARSVSRRGEDGVPRRRKQLDGELVAGAAMIGHEDGVG